MKYFSRNKDTLLDVNMQMLLFVYFTHKNYILNKKFLIKYIDIYLHNCEIKLGHFAPHFPYKEELER